MSLLKPWIPIQERDLKKQNRHPHMLMIIIWIGIISL